MYMSEIRPIRQQAGPRKAQGKLLLYMPPPAEETENQCHQWLSLWQSHPKARRHEGTRSQNQCRTPSLSLTAQPPFREEKPENLKFPKTQPSGHHNVTRWRKRKIQNTAQSLSAQRSVANDDLHGDRNGPLLARQHDFSLASEPILLSTTISISLQALRSALEPQNVGHHKK